MLLFEKKNKDRTINIEYYHLIGDEFRFHRDNEREKKHSHTHSNGDEYNSNNSRYQTKKSHLQSYNRALGSIANR